MRIDCPSCGAGYDLAPDQVPPGRGVRCARCGNVWAPVALVDAAPPIPLPPAPDLAPEPELEPSVPEPAAMAMEMETHAAVAFERATDDRELPGEPPGELSEEQPDMPPAALVPTFVATRPTGHPKPARRGIPLWGGWLATVLVLLALGWGAVTYRANVMAAWPPSARAYAWVGLAARAR